LVWKRPSTSNVIGLDKAFIFTLPEAVAPNCLYLCKSRSA
jgi:hypothetical protein